MESLTNPVRYIFKTTVNKILIIGSVPDYYLHLEGSWESIFIGNDEPDLKVGDKVNVTIEKVP